jgi:hypothetical protein
MINVEPGQGIEERDLVVPSGSWASRKSFMIVSGGVVAVQTVELSWSGSDMGLGETALRVMVS